MKKPSKITPKFVEFIPSSLEEGVLYISKKYSTAAHLCCCGCGTKIVTPLKPTDWTLTESSDGVTLHPSIGNWNHPCQSHYLIQSNHVVWSGKMSQAEIDYGRALNAAAKNIHYGKPTDFQVKTSQSPAPSSAQQNKPQGWWSRFILWLKS